MLAKFTRSHFEVPASYAFARGHGRRFRVGMAVGGSFPRRVLIASILRRWQGVARWFMPVLHDVPVLRYKFLQELSD
jgi:hypothetical protein